MGVQTGGLWMMRWNTGVLAGVFLLLLLLTGCAGSVRAEEVVGKTYVYEQEGFGGEFTISIQEDGSFDYYEGPFSSHLGRGRWELEGDILTLRDKEFDRVNRFRVREGELVFREKGSGGFLYVQVKDGERFVAS